LFAPSARRSSSPRPTPLARQITAGALADSIHAHNFQTLVRLRETWTASVDLADLTKRAIRAICAALACGDALIRNQAARSFAVVLAVEKDGFADALGELSDSVLAFLAFLEALHLPFLKKLKTPRLLDCFCGIFTQAISILGAPAEVGQELRPAAGECVRDAVEFLPELCHTGQAADICKIRGVLAAVRVTLSISNLFIFKCCHRIMFNLVTAYYQAADQFMEFIFEQTVAIVLAEARAF
jgi:hypothetical protein